MLGDKTPEKNGSFEENLELVASQLSGTDENLAAILNFIEQMKKEGAVPDWALDDPKRVKRYIRRSARNLEIDGSRRQEVHRKFLGRSFHNTGVSDSFMEECSVSNDFIRYVRWLVTTGNLASIWVRQIEYGMTQSEFIESKYRAPTDEQPWPKMSSLHYVRKRIKIEKELIRQALESVIDEIRGHENDTIDHVKKYSVFARTGAGLIVLFRKKLV